MKEGNVIEVKNLKKKFKVFYDKGNSLKEKLLFQKRNRYEERWVLQGIDFEVKKGEAIGLIGKNGCGKSTTLKMLTRIMYPSEGTIEMKGRVSSLLELGAGFHPDMSGRENIYINASIFGLTKKEIDKRIEDIIEFSELREFIDNPVRTYSSGMYMRLAFSVAINVDADILLIDEILAVGDVSFQTKCFEKLKDIKASGTTIVLVSHSTSQIEQICDRAIWIENGVIREQGIPKFVNEHYLQAMEENRLDKIEKAFQEKVEARNEETANEEIKPEPADGIPAFCSDRAVNVGNRMAEVANCQILGADGKERKVYHSGEELRVRVTLKEKEEPFEVNVAVSISRDDGLYCYGHSTYAENNYLLDLKREHQITFRIPHLPLLSGKYYINIGVYSRDYVEYHVIWNATDFQVLSDQNGEVGIFKVDHNWLVNE